MIGLLEVAPATILDKLGYGGQMFLIGMGTIFLVLSVLWACLEILHFMIGRFTNKNGSSKHENSQQIVVTPQAAVGTSTSEEEEIVAAICAAIAAAQAEDPQLQFRAVAFKRIH